jgi:hypothetical protein
VKVTAMLGLERRERGGMIAPSSREPPDIAP